MAENSRPPVAIRIVRPYDTEDELLENELETIGKTSVVLIGAHPRPTGVILRFEVTLASGPTVLRGEGRVLAHKENAFRGQSGLTLRFTRLDPKSKAIVDRATALREARVSVPPSAEAPSPSRPAPRPDSPIADALSAATPSPGPTVSGADQEAAVASARAAARDKANATARANAKRTGRAQGLTPPPPPGGRSAQEQSEHEHEQDEAAAAAPEPTPVTSIPGAVTETAAAHMERRPSRPPNGPTGAAPVAAPTISAPQPAPARGAPRANAEASSATTEAPPNREELLSRLRERAGRLPPERVEEILAARALR